VFGYEVLDFVGFELCVRLMRICILCCSPREMNKGDEVAWYADGDNMVHNEYNLSIAYAFGECSWAHCCAILHCGTVRFAKELYLLFARKGDKIG
jgi:hypothetical protein